MKVTKHQRWLCPRGVLAFWMSMMHHISPIWPHHYFCILYELLKHSTAIISLINMLPESSCYLLRDTCCCLNLGQGGGSIRARVTPEPPFEKQCPLTQPWPWNFKITMYRTFLTSPAWNWNCPPFWIYLKWMLSCPLLLLNHRRLNPLNGHVDCYLVWYDHFLNHCA